MKITVQYEKTQHLTAETEVDDAALLKYVNNGGEHKYADLDTARADLGSEFFDILVEFVAEGDPDSEEGTWTNVQDAGPAVVDVEQVALL